MKPSGRERKQLLREAIELLEKAEPYVTPSEMVYDDDYVEDIKRKINSWLKRAKEL